MGNAVVLGKSFEPAVQRDAGETPVSRNDEQAASKIQSESEPLLAQALRSRSIEIPPAPTQRRPYSLSEPNGTNQDPIVGSSSAPTSNKNQETLSYSVDPSESGKAVFRHKVSQNLAKLQAKV